MALDRYYTFMAHLTPKEEHLYREQLPQKVTNKQLDKVKNERWISVKEKEKYGAWQYDCVIRQRNNLPPIEFAPIEKEEETSTQQKQQKQHTQKHITKKPISKRRITDLCVNYLHLFFSIDILSKSELAEHFKLGTSTVYQILRGDLYRKIGARYLKDRTDADKNISNDEINGADAN